MNKFKQGTKVLVKGKPGMHYITTGAVTSRNRIRVSNLKGSTYQVTTSKLKVLTPENIKLIAKYEKLMNW